MITSVIIGRTRQGPGRLSRSESPSTAPSSTLGRTVVSSKQRRTPGARNEVSAMTSDRTILITGVTGNQGGAVAQALQGAGFYLRGLTRKPDSEWAAALARHGVDIVKGDLEDETTLRRPWAATW